MNSAEGICFGCVVQAECLNYAMQAPDLTGIWGGTSHRERRLRAERRAPERPPPCQVSGPITLAPDLQKRW